MKNGCWTNGKSVRHGKWEWQWAHNRFMVWLDKPVSYYGEMRKTLDLLGYDTPEWGKWQLIR